MNTYEYPGAINYVTNRLSSPALLGQLAEEAAELGKAALKLQRILMDENPTRATKPEVMKSLIEEAADVYCSLDAIITKLNIAYDKDIMPTICDKGIQWEKCVRKKYNDPKKGEEK